jgi:hypothetical protein
MARLTMIDKRLAEISSLPLTIPIGATVEAMRKKVISVFGNWIPE